MSAVSSQPPRTPARVARSRLSPYRRPPFLKVTYAVLAAPFLIFAAPVLGHGLTGAREPAYDRSGHCVPMLNKMQLKEKYDFEKKHGTHDFLEKQAALI